MRKSNKERESKIKELQNYFYKLVMHGVFFGSNQKIRRVNPELRKKNKRITERNKNI